MEEFTSSIPEAGTLSLDVNKNTTSNEVCVSETDGTHDSMLVTLANNELLPKVATESSNENLLSKEKILTEYSLQCLGGNDVTNSEIKNVNLDSSFGLDCVLHDADNNLLDNREPVDFLGLKTNVSDNSFGTVPPEFCKENNEAVILKEEEFHDAVQFFKDPSSIKFLENAGNSASTESALTRSSLYVRFDPLNSNFGKKLENNAPELQHTSNAIVKPDYANENVNFDFGEEIPEKKFEIKPARESLSNVLISFDSPLKVKAEVQYEEPTTSVALPKLYTEEELQQALKVQELSIQERYLKKQQELEQCIMNKTHEIEDKVKFYTNIFRSYHEMLSDFATICTIFFEKQRDLSKSVENKNIENEKLTLELKTATEDLESVESTFTDFHKRYEQCKSMLKVYKDNEDVLKQKVENLQNQLQEQESMYTMLQSRTQEMLEKANDEVANAKKSNEAHVAVLKAQLKKAELKISGLESDNKQIKIENSKLGGICDDLMAKVSET